MCVTACVVAVKWISKIHFLCINRSIPCAAVHTNHKHLCIVCVPKCVSGYSCGPASMCYTLKPTFVFRGEAASLSRERICFSLFLTHSCIFTAENRAKAESKMEGGEIKRKRVFPKEMSDQRTGLFHNQPG